MKLAGVALGGGLIGAVLGFAVGLRWAAPPPSRPAPRAASSASAPTPAPLPPERAATTPPTSAAAPSPSADVPAVRPVPPDLSEAVRALGSESESALEEIRGFLLRASPAERRALDPLLAQKLRSMPLESRAEALRSLFRSKGWLGEQPGPPWPAGRTREVFVETIRDLPLGDAHSQLVEVMAHRMTADRGVDLWQLLPPADMTLATERARLEGSPPEPAVDLGPFALQQLARVDDLAGLSEGLPLLALGGAAASPAERRALMDYADGSPTDRVRVTALLALATVGASAEVDAYLARAAAAEGRKLADRLAAWSSLRRRGGEACLPAPARQALLEAWERSGVPSAVEVMF